MIRFVVGIALGLSALFVAVVLVGFVIEMTLSDLDHLTKYKVAAYFVGFGATALAFFGFLFGVVLKVMRIEL